MPKGIHLVLYISVHNYQLFPGKHFSSYLLLILDVSLYLLEVRVKLFVIKLLNIKFIFNLYINTFSSVQFSHSVMSNSLKPHESQHTRPPCPSSTLRGHSNSCPLSQWCLPVISSSFVPFSSFPPIPPSIRDFSSESALSITWPKYWSFSFTFQWTPRTDLL